MHTWNKTQHAPIRFIQGRFGVNSIVVSFKTRYKAPIDVMWSYETKEHIQRDPYGYELIHRRAFDVSDILQALLLVSLEYHKQQFIYIPDYFEKALQLTIEYNNESIFASIPMLSGITPQHFYCIVENWFLALYEFLLELYMRHEIEYLCRLDFIKVVPHGIVFKEK